MEIMLDFGNIHATIVVSAVFVAALAYLLK
jgi:hypothetical protein